jgi:molybdopterin molybdotransferase
MPVSRELLTREEALALVLSRVRPLPNERVDLASAAGRVLAVDARAATDLPPFPSSAMDGFALRADDTPGRLPVVARIAAGSPSPAPLEPGQAMTIATGGVVPGGADAVVPIELVVEEDNSVLVGDHVARSANVRPRGGDVVRGDVVVRAGTRLGAAHVGALAAAGVGVVECARRPLAAVVPTGSELRAPGEPLGDGEIYESNASLLAVALAAGGAEVQRLAITADDERAHRDALEQALEADVVVTSGGVSVGPHDLVRRVERELGVEEVFWRVAVKPGKPISFGVRGETLVFGLPGNPVSSLVAHELFVRPAVLALQGAADPGPSFARGRLAATVRRNAERDELLRARRRVDDAGTVFEPVSGQESHMIVRAADADALILVPRGDGELAAGETVDYLVLG